MTLFCGFLIMFQSDVTSAHPRPSVRLPIIMGRYSFPRPVEFSAESYGICCQAAEFRVFRSNSPISLQCDSSRQRKFQEASRPGSEKTANRFRRPYHFQLHSDCSLLNLYTQTQMQQRRTQNVT